MTTALDFKSTIKVSAFVETKICNILLRLLPFSGCSHSQLHIVTLHSWTIILYFAQIAVAFLFLIVSVSRMPLSKDNSREASIIVMHWLCWIGIIKARHSTSIKHAVLLATRVATFKMATGLNPSRLVQTYYPCFATYHSAYFSQHYDFIWL